MQFIPNQFIFFTFLYGDESPVLITHYKHFLVWCEKLFIAKLTQGSEELEMLTDIEDL